MKVPASVSCVRLAQIAEGLYIYGWQKLPIIFSFYQYKEAYYYTFFCLWYFLSRKSMHVKNATLLLLFDLYMSTREATIMAHQVMVQGKLSIRRLTLISSSSI